MTEAEVDQVALALPEVVKEGSGYGFRGKGIAWYYQEKIEGQKGRVERRDVLAVRVPNLDEKDVLLMSDPQKFFTTPHYNGFPAVLVRLPSIDAEEMAELLTAAWRIRAPKKLQKEFDARPANS